MAANRAKDFLNCTLRSGLVSDEQLRAELQQLQQQDAPALDQPERIAAQLVSRGLLTSWQSQQLLNGRYRGFTLGNYRLLAPLGSGGMSMVYVGEHLRMQREVAIKILPKSKLDNPAYLDQFLVEARAAAALSHPHIVRAYDFDRDGDTHFLVMERLHGLTLHQIVRRQHPLPLTDIVNYAQQAAEGLAYAHEQGLVHRDIKPANLMVTDDGQLKILDMGLAHWSQSADDAAADAARPKTVVGTADFLAPEQSLDSQNVDGRADVYSLGCTLYFMLTASPPYPAGTLAEKIRQHRTAEPPSLHRGRPDCPTPLAKLCREMMAKAPAQRTATMRQVVDRLARLEFIGLPAGVVDTEFAPDPTKPPIPLPRSRNARGRSTRRRPLPWWFWFALIVLIAVASWLFYQVQRQGLAF